MRSGERVEERVSDSLFRCRLGRAESLCCPPDKKGITPMTIVIIILGAVGDLVSFWSNEGPMAFLFLELAHLHFF